MEIWLKGKKKLRIPVLPSEYVVTSEQYSTVVNTYGMGDIALRGKRGLERLSFSSFFPKINDPDYVDVSNLKSPKYYVKQIEELKRAGKMKVLITETTVNYYATITNFEWGERDGTGDIYYTIDFQEYRKVSAAASVVVTESSLIGAVTAPETATREAPEANTASVQTYEVRKGDTLTTIARKKTNSADYKPIYEQNKAIIGSNPNNIQVGMILTIPAKQGG